MTLPVHVIGPRSAVLELKRTVFFLKIFLHRLKKHQRISRAVPQLVLGEIRSDRVRPRRELLRPVEPVKVPVYPDEHLLNEILRLLPVTDRAIYEIQETRLIPVDQLRKCSLFSAQERRNHARIIHGAKLFPDTRSLLPYCMLTSDYCHDTTPQR